MLSPASTHCQKMHLTLPRKRLGSIELLTSYKPIGIAKLSSLACKYSYMYLPSPPKMRNRA